MRTHRLPLALTLLLAVVLLPAPLFAQSPRLQLARDGQALVQVNISPDADERTQELAAVLADYLGRIAQAPFTVAQEGTADGIVVGLVVHWPQLQLDSQLQETGSAGEEQYLLRTHDRGLYVIARHPLGLQHAVWDLLYRLGHRQFFPGETWEVVPTQRDLAIAVDVNESPDYLFRRIWYGYGTWRDFDKVQKEWRVRNRAESGFVLNTGHAYDGIIDRYESEFKEHPEYLGLVNGKRTSSKFCVANPGLQQLIVRYAREFFQRSPQADSVSIDPSDGGGWCECQDCLAIGTPSDRALTLANLISDMIEQEFPDKYVAMYAYNQHAPPPNIQAKPRVIINSATAFLKGQSVYDVIDGWNAKGIKRFGIREYYGVNTWDRDLPSGPRGSDIAYLSRTITSFYDKGARFITAESSDNWGPSGLGYYLAQRMMWDVTEAQHIEELFTDFLTKAFGPAHEPMRKFYHLLNFEKKILISEDLLGRMYRYLDEAYRLTDDPRIHARIDSLTLYTRYVELFTAYSSNRGDERQAAFEALIRHAYRSRRSYMVHSLALYRDLANRDKSVRVPPDAHWQKEEGPRRTQQDKEMADLFGEEARDLPPEGNPWKSSEPWTRAELDALRANGIANNKLISFTPVAFSRDLVPADALNFPSRPRLSDAETDRGGRTFYTWVTDPSRPLELKVTAGMIAHYRDRGPAVVDWAWVDDPEGNDADSGQSNPDGIERIITLKAQQPGLYRVSASDGMDKTRISWPEGWHRTIEVSFESSPSHSGERNAYFYVPRGTKVVGGFANASRGRILDGAGNEILTFSGGGNYFEVPVPAGQDGKLWSLDDFNGTLRLMTVPPFVARSPQELLLPREVVEADAAATVKPQ